MTRFIAVTISLVLFLHSAQIALGARLPKPPSRDREPPADPGPAAAKAPKDAPSRAEELGMGLWSIDAATGQTKFLHPWWGPCAITRDKSLVAVFGLSPEERGAARQARGGVRSPPPRNEGEILRVGPPASQLNLLWDNAKTQYPASFHMAPTVRWSEGGKAVFVHAGGSLVAVDLRGRSQLFGEAADRQALPAKGPVAKAPPVRAAPAAESAEAALARWAGKSDSEIVVAGKDLSLRVISLETGASRPLCPVPPGFGYTAGYFDLSETGDTVAFFCGAPRRPKPAGDAGVWIWRRGQREPARITDQIGAVDPRGGVEINAISRDGKYVAVSGPPPSKIYETATCKVVWQAGDPPVFGEFAFDSAGRNVAMVGPRGIYVMALADLKPRLLGAPEKASAVLQLAWSADGKELLFQTQGPGVPDFEWIYRIMQVP